ncbi:Protein trichome birefringence [Rhynchospora pubera]|uniref:Protein trichome birefringence n=1 Tax=Rhynchospora pubera TaxID=906938 RepID=A0AAV8CP98_9POAL|nr:Protein trichome birefringence [Rhynchospora pubera]
MVIGSAALCGLIFTEHFRSVTGKAMDMLNASTLQAIYDSSMAWKKEEEGMIEGDDQFKFDPKNCSVTNGKWVFKESKNLPYNESTCPYLDDIVKCRSNGRPDKDYMYWEWELDDCTLPRFDAKSVLRKLKGKRLMFVGDSLQLYQWLSFVCLVQSVIPATEKSMHKTITLSVFTAKEYNATIEFYWTPFLIESNTDVQIVGDPSQRILHLDSIEKHAQHWTGVDILVFDTYVWWMNADKIKSVWGKFANADEGFEELDRTVAYRIGLRTWANWIDSTLDPNKAKVFFTTMSPTHFRSEDWSHKGNIRCFNETRPVLEKGYWGTSSNRGMMEVVSSMLERMRTPVTVLNVTQLSEHRIDGHVSVYTASQGRPLTDEQKANPQQYADCIHWCLPGVPDTWNQLLYAYL